MALVSFWRESRKDGGEHLDVMRDEILGMLGSAGKKCQ